MGGGGATAPQVFLGNHKAVFFDKFTHIKPLRYFGTKQTTDVMQFKLAHKKTLNMRFTVYSLQFYTLRPIVMREQPVEKVQDSSLIEFLLKFFEAPSCLWLSFGSWSSFCNPCSQSEYRRNRRNLTETCNNSEPASLCFVLFFTAIITRCQLFKTSWCSEARAVRKPVLLANKKPTIAKRAIWLATNWWKYPVDRRPCPTQNVLKTSNPS